MAPCCLFLLYQKSPKNRTMSEIQLKLTPRAIASFLDLCFPTNENITQVKKQFYEENIRNQVQEWRWKGIPCNIA